ncbi:MAG: hypothetical protein ABIJ96_11665 [Elusimicrobiota bacterium]
MAKPQDKVALLIEETGCDRGEAELALELCGFDLESAVKAIPRLFQNIVVLKARIRAVEVSRYGLLLVILNLKEKSLLRARAVVSHNPAVFVSELDQHWFDFEARLYACRLWVGTVQEESQSVEHLLSSYFASPEAANFYNERSDYTHDDFAVLRTALSAKLGSAVELFAQQDLLDMGQFREVRPRGEASGGGKGAKRKSRSKGTQRQVPGGMLVLDVDFEHDEAGGTPAASLSAGDLVYTRISDTRDIAQYLSKLFGSRSEEGGSPLLVPVEAIEKDELGRMTIRVRFSAGVCGDLTVSGTTMLKAVPRLSNMPWWKKIFGRT